MTKVEARVAVQVLAWTAGEDGGYVPAIGKEPHYWCHTDARTVSEIEAMLRAAGFKIVEGPRAVRRGR